MRPCGPGPHHHARLIRLCSLRRFQKHGRDTIRSKWRIQQRGLGMGHLCGSLQQLRRVERTGKQAAVPAGCDNWRRPMARGPPRGCRNTRLPPAGARPGSLKRGSMRASTSTSSTLTRHSPTCLRAQGPDSQQQSPHAAKRVQHPICLQRSLIVAGVHKWRTGAAQTVSGAKRYYGRGMAGSATA